MPLEYPLFALASLGHGCLLMVAVNITYSRPFHRLFLKVFRTVMGLLIFGGPVAYLCFVGVSVTPIIENAGRTPVLAAYLLFVLTVACVGLPYVTLRRNLRPRPLCVLDEVTKTIDIAEELGAPPIGDGETAHLTRLPFNDIFRVDFTILTVALPNWPAAWDGLTLLQLSDLHFLGTPSSSYFDRIIQHCMADGIPDLVAITGDIVDTDKHLGWIGPILGELRWNVAAFAILGNHDWWNDFTAVRKELRLAGIHVVSNAWEQIDVRGEKLTVIGHEGPWFQPAPDLSKCPAAGFRILLSHTPDNIRWAQRNNVSLMLSGHSHGGQVRLPLIGSIFVPSRFSRRYDMGTFFEPPTLLHVNRGLSGKEPIRFRCRPQVTRFVLRSAVR